jgi:cyclopropane fatty-acyl-phospholipid synthase-like methyltransferase
MNSGEKSNLLLIMKIVWYNLNMGYKPNFTRKKKRQVHGATFWEQEYKSPIHLKLSTAPSEDMVKFTRWLKRSDSSYLLKSGDSVLDVGCGNGRNLIYLANEFGLSGIGFDISKSAIVQARQNSGDLPIKYTARSIAGDLKQVPESNNLVLDMMTSHFLNKPERLGLRDEIHKTLKPGGFLFMKTFLKDEDLHTIRLLKDSPGKEIGSYIHPVMGVPEYVYSEEELINFLSEKFTIHKIYRSHKHAFRGQARKRRTITVYAEKALR